MPPGRRFGHGATRPNRANAQLGFQVLLAALLVHCTPRPDHHEPHRPQPRFPPPAAVTASALDAGSEPAPAIEGEDIGRFRLRIAISAGPDVTCFPGFTELDVLENGQVWLSGLCGVRARVEAAGMLADFSAPWKTAGFW